MPSNAIDTELEFPLGGVHETTEFHEQPPGTTARGVNVRGLDGSSLRQRGASRPGLKRYIAQRLPSGDHEIQMLQMIVDPQATALQQNFDVPGADWTVDPLHPDQWIPPTGAGWQPNPNADPPVDEDEGEILFVQKKGQNGFGLTAAMQTMVFDNPVHNGTDDRLVLIFVGTSHNVNLGLEVTVESDTGPFTRIGEGNADDGYRRITDGGFETSISIWYRMVTADAGEPTINVTPSALGFLKFFGANFSGLNAAPTVDDNFTSGSGSSVSTGIVDIAGEGRLLVGLFGLTSSDRLNFEAEPEVVGLFHFDVGGTPTDQLTGSPVLCAGFRINPAAVTDQMDAVTVSGAVDYAAIGASFKN